MSVSVSLSMPECKCPFNPDEDTRSLRTVIGTPAFNFSIFRQDCSLHWVKVYIITLGL